MKDNKSFSIHKIIVNGDSAEMNARKVQELFRMVKALGAPDLTCEIEAEKPGDCDTHWRVKLTGHAAR